MANIGLAWVTAGAAHQTGKCRQLRQAMRGDGLSFHVDHRPDRLR